METKWDRFTFLESCSAGKNASRVGTFLLKKSTQKKVGVAIAWSIASARALAKNSALCCFLNASRPQTPKRFLKGMSLREEKRIKRSAPWQQRRSEVQRGARLRGSEAMRGKCEASSLKIAKSCFSCVFMLYPQLRAWRATSLYASCAQLHCATMRNFTRHSRNFTQSHSHLISHFSFFV